jgi:hypothetical protein
MLGKLRLHLADRPDIELAVELEEDDGDPWTLLRALADSDGRIPLGDRESYPVERVVDVELIRPERVDGPRYERGLQDEDVSAAVSENYDPGAGSSDEKRV